MQAPAEPASAAINAKTPVINQIIDAFGIAIYFALGLLAIWGIYNIVLVLGNLKTDRTPFNAGLLRRCNFCLPVCEIQTDSSGPAS
jgi:hypothetical protein